MFLLEFKKDKMGSCGTPECINRAEKNSDNISTIITLTTLIIMLLELNSSIFRTLTYLMPGAYLKPCQICKTVRYIENPVIDRTFYSGIFRNT